MSAPPPGPRSWLPNESFRSGEPFYYELEPNDDDAHWAECSRLVKDFDDDRCTRWKDEINYLLIFAGLFSAVGTAFFVETLKLLQEDPQATAALLLAQIANNMGASSQPPITTSLEPFSLTTQSIRINAFAVLSLVLSLSTVLLGILCLQWIRAFQKKENLSPQEFLKIRQVRYEGFEQWKVPNIVASLPTLLLAALVLFFAGLIDFLITLHRGVAFAVAGVAGATIFVLLVTTALPAVLMFLRVMAMNGKKPAGSQCPYKSAQSWAFFRMFYLPISFFLSTFKGRSWGDKEPRRFQSRLENLYQVALAQSWSHYDIASKFLQGVEIDSPMSWIAKVFNQTYNSVAIIYRCFRDIDVGGAWSAYWRINGTPAPNDADPAAIPVALLNYFCRMSEVRQSPSLVLHHFELYNRILGSGQPFGNLPLARSYTPQCPDLSWREYGIFNTMDVPADIQLETLHNLLNLISRPQHNIQYHEIRTIWHVVYWVLQSPSVLDSDVPHILSSAFQTLQTRFPTIQTTTTSDPSQITLADWCRAFHEQLIFPIIKKQPLYDDLFRIRLDGMVKSPDFQACLALMSTTPEFIDRRSRWQAQTWESFSAILNAAAFWQPLDSGRDGATPISVSDSGYALNQGYQNANTWANAAQPTWGSSPWIYDSQERVRMSASVSSYPGYPRSLPPRRQMATSDSLERRRRSSSQRPYPPQSYSSFSSPGVPDASASNTPWPDERTPGSFPNSHSSAPNTSIVPTIHGRHGVHFVPNSTTLSSHLPPGIVPPSPIPDFDNGLIIPGSKSPYITLLPLPSPANTNIPGYPTLPSAPSQYNPPSKPFMKHASANFATGSSYGLPYASSGSTQQHQMPTFVPPMSSQMQMQMRSPPMRRDSVYPRDMPHLVPPPPAPSRGQGQNPSRRDSYSSSSYMYPPTPDQGSAWLPGSTSTGQARPTGSWYRRVDAYDPATGQYRIPGPPPPPLSPVYESPFRDASRGREKVRARSQYAVSGLTPVSVSQDDDDDSGEDSDATNEGEHETRSPRAQEDEDVSGNEQNGKGKQKEDAKHPVSPGINEEKEEPAEEEGTDVIDRENAYEGPSGTREIPDYAIRNGAWA